MKSASFPVSFFAAPERGFLHLRPYIISDFLYVPGGQRVSVAAVDKTVYVTASGLNVRAGCSTDDRILGTLAYGTAVRVTGNVQRNGADYGWRQVSYGSGTGYVSANFLSDQAPEQKKAEPQTPSKPEYTGNVKTVCDEIGNVFTLSERTDGMWCDKDGTRYTRHSATDFQVYEGNKHLTVY